MLPSCAGVRRLLCLLCAVVVCGQGAAQDTEQNLYKRLSLEELADIDVTAVTRRAEPVGSIAAAVTVLTSEEIRRSGATNVPELLRRVPGLHVAQFNATSWAISARGFNSTAANKLLVLIDGRPAYSPLFSGTFWDVQDLVLDDISRIEVVRGPGATLWGANAVNGFINIITKTAHQTTGGLVAAAGGGAYDLARLSVRGGDMLSPNTSYRVFGKYWYRDQLKFANGQDSQDSAGMGRLGFRADRTQGNNDFMLSGDFYNGTEGLFARESGKVLGGHLRGRWTRTLSTSSEFSIQGYYERNYRRIPLQSEFDQRTVDIEVQHEFVPTDGHILVWGMEFQWNTNRTTPTGVVSFTPRDRSYPLWSAFVQDELSILGDRMRIQFGSKLEHNDFSGVEIQPSVRAAWEPVADQTVWGAVSRAVRTPTRFDTDIQFRPPGLNIQGNPDLQAEEVLAFEAGYRTRPAPRISLDFAGFYNLYDRIRSIELLNLAGDVTLRNNLNVTSWGGEVSASVDMSESLRITTGYSSFRRTLTTEPGASDIFAGSLEGNDPRHQFLIRTSADILGNFEWDSMLRFVGALPSPPVPHYVELESRFGWTPTSSINIAIVGRNLLDRQHPEFGNPSPVRPEVKRNIYLEASFRFH